MLRSVTAFSLASDLFGISMPSIALTPLFCASVTAAFVVALSIAWSAAFWASVTFCFKAAFSSSVKFEASIALFFASAASATARLAACFASDSAGTEVSLIFLTPLPWALVTASGVVAALTASLAAWAFWSTSLFKAAFSSSVNDELEISAFLPATALSMAALATSLSIANVPLSAAFLTSSLVLALLMASWAVLASESIWSLAACFCSSVKLLSWSIVFLASSTAVLRSVMACSLVADVIGTSMPSIALIPLSLASVTAALVVALSIAWSAPFCASVTFCFNAAFSSSVKFDESIALFLASAASATAFLAASLAVDVVGTEVALIFLMPFPCAVVTASGVVALLIASLALFAFWSTSLFKAVFSSSVNDELEISAFLPATALSMAALATSLSIANVPS